RTAQCGAGLHAYNLRRRNPHQRPARHDQSQPALRAGIGWQTMMRSDLPPPGMPWNGFSPARRWTMLAVLFLVSTVSFIDRSILQILLESIRREFEMSDRMLGLLSGAPFAICYAALSIPFGRAAD